MYTTSPFINIRYNFQKIYIFLALSVTLAGATLALIWPRGIVFSKNQATRLGTAYFLQTVIVLCHNYHSLFYFKDLSSNTINIVEKQRSLVGTV